MSKIVVLIGAPGAGKGTQAKLLQERKNIPQISTGEIFREMKNSNTPLALEVQEIMAQGKLISDELTFEVVKNRTSREDCASTYILDGYPRTAVQAEQLEKLAQGQNKNIEAVLVDVPLEILEKRMTGRRSCSLCGNIYNIYFKKPKQDNVCDEHPESRLTHRADDNEESVKTRLATYDSLTKPLIDYYEKSNRLKKVRGDREVEEIYADLEKLV
jgi:adenylate kinase